MRLVFLDTETTGLDPTKHVPWDIAMIAVDFDEQGRVVTETTRQMFVLPPADAEIDLPPEFGQKMADRLAKAHPTRLWTPRTAAIAVDNVTAGANIVAANPTFDAEMLAAFMGREGFKSRWHYHLVDIEALAEGYLLGSNPMILPDHHRRLKDYAAMLDVYVDPASHHTALGDAQVVRNIYSTITTNRGPFFGFGLL